MGGPRLWRGWWHRFVPVVPVIGWCDHTSPEPIRLADPGPDPGLEVIIRAGDGEMWRWLVGVGVRKWMALPPHSRRRGDGSRIGWGMPIRPEHS